MGIFTARECPPGQPTRAPLPAFQGKPRPAPPNRRHPAPRARNQLLSSAPALTGGCSQRMELHRSRSASHSARSCHRTTHPHEQLPQRRHTQPRHGFPDRRRTQHRPRRTPPLTLQTYGGQPGDLLIALPGEQAHRQHEVGRPPTPRQQSVPLHAARSPPAPRPPATGETPVAAPRARRDPTVAHQMTSVDPTLDTSTTYDRIAPKLLALRLVLGGPSGYCPGSTSWISSRDQAGQIFSKAR